MILGTTYLNLNQFRRKDMETQNHEELPRDRVNGTFTAQILAFTYPKSRCFLLSTLLC